MFNKSTALKLIAVTGFLCASLVTAQASGGTYISPTGGGTANIDGTATYTWNFPSGYTGDVQGFILQLNGWIDGETPQILLTLYDNATQVATSSVDQGGYYGPGGNNETYTAITFDFGTPQSLTSSDVYTATLSLYLPASGDVGSINVQTGSSSDFGGGEGGGTSDTPEPGSLSMIGIGVAAIAAGRKWARR